MATVLEELLDAHVRYELEARSGAALSSRVAEHVSSLFSWLQSVKLDDVCTRAEIEGVVQRYVVDFRVGGGLTELWGEFSRLVYSSPTTQRVTVEHVLPDDLYEEFAEVVANLSGVRHALSRWLAESRALETLEVRLLLTTLLSSSLPGGSQRARTSTQRVREWLSATMLPPLEQRVLAIMQSVRAEARKTQEGTRTKLLDPGLLRSVLDEIWQRVSPARLSVVFSAIGERDLEDFIVLGYEFWLRFRKSPYFRDVVHELIEYFFARYGQASLAVLLDEVGVTKEMVMLELQTFLAPLLAHAARTGELERQVRSALRPFYSSEIARHVLESRLARDATS
jgi:hypothetical protein